ncbi:hypothetical protein AMTRI_Chr04g182650 [Amborella trichopoda]
MAKLADVAERYSDMVEYMTLLMCCEHGVVLNPEELEMLWMAYKNFTNCQWSSLCATIVSQASELDTHRPTIIRDYRYRLESELNSILVLLNSHLIPSFVNYWVSRIQYLKMKGDYHLHFARMIRGAWDKRNTPHSPHGLAWISISHFCGPCTSTLKFYTSKLLLQLHKRSWMSTPLRLWRMRKRTRAVNPSL